MSDIIIGEVTDILEEFVDSDISLLGILEQTPEGSIEDISLIKSNLTFHDFGGKILYLVGALKNEEALISVESQGRIYEFYSGVRGKSYSPSPLKAGIIKVVIPPLPVGGPYNIKITQGQDTAELTNALTIVPRNWHSKIYNFKSRFPSWMYFGYRNILEENLLLSDLTLGSISNKTLFAGEAFSIKIPFYSPEGASITITDVGNNLPVWANLDQDNYLIEGTPPKVDIGNSYFINLQISDGDNTLSFGIFSLTVEAKLFAIDTIANQDIQVGDNTFSFEPIVSNPSELDLTWSIHSGFLPDGITLNPSTGELSGEPSIDSLLDYSGVYSVQLEVTGGSFTVLTNSFTLNIIGVSIPIPIVYLPLNGEFNDDTGNTAVINNGSTFTTNGNKQVALFDENLDYVVIQGTDIVLHPNENWTLHLQSLIEPASNVGDRLISKVSTCYGALLEILDEETLSFKFSDELAEVEVNINQAQDVRDSVWKTYTFKSDSLSQTLRSYSLGIERDVVSTEDLVIGSGADEVALGYDRIQPINSFKGRISEFCVWDIGLSELQIATLEWLRSSNNSIGAWVNLSAQQGLPPQALGATPPPCIISSPIVPPSASNATLKLWLDAADVNNDGGNSQPANNSSVNLWYDKSGNNYIFENSGTAPLFQEAGFNSTYPTLSFQSSNGEMRPQLASGFDENPAINFSIFMVVQDPGGNSRYAFAYVGGGSNGDAVYLDASNSFGFGYYYNNANRISQVGGSGNFLITLLLDDTAPVNDRAILRFNQVEQGRSEHWAKKTWIDSHLYWAIGRTTNFTGKVSEVLVYKGEVSEAEAINIENWLAARWGL